MDALVKILEKRDINYINLWDLFEEPENNGETEFFADGLHPNDKGHLKIAETVAKFIKTDSKIC